MPLTRPGGVRLHVLFLDFAVSATVIGATLAALLPNAQPAAFKARFVAVLMAMATERTAQIEEHAHTGVWGPPPLHRAAIAGREVTASMQPVPADAAGSWSVRWLCRADLPDALAPSACRARGGS